MRRPAGPRSPEPRGTGPGHPGPGGARPGPASPGEAPHEAPGARGRAHDRSPSPDRTAHGDRPSTADAHRGATAPGERLRQARDALRTARRNRRRAERGEARRFGRQARRRRAVVLASAAVVVAVIGGSVTMAFSPLTALRTVTVVGATGSTAAEVRHAVSGQLGRPLASISRSEVHDALAKIDRIGSYSLALKPPNTMVLRVTQRVPVAAVRHAGGYATVDAAGVSLAQSRARPALPLVTSRVDTKGFAAAIQVIQALPATVDKRVDTVSATSLDNVAFTLRGHHGATVVWGDRSKPALKAKVLTALLGAVPHAARYDVSSPGDAVTR